MNINQNQNIGKLSHTEGFHTRAEGEYSHAEGFYTLTEGYGAHAEGDSTRAEGYSSHSEGFYSHAKGYSSHVEGYSSLGYGYSSHTEGEYSYAEGNSSHAEGFCSCAEGFASHAEGGSEVINKYITGPINSKIYSINDINNLFVGMSLKFTTIINKKIINYTAKIIFINKDKKTITVNITLNPDKDFKNQKIECYTNSAKGDYSHSEGNGTIAVGLAQHVQGQYNEPDPKYEVNNLNIRGKYAHIVGNGTSNDNRSNAHTLDQEGNAWFAGGIELTSPNGIKYKITITDEGKLITTKISE